METETLTKLGINFLTEKEYAEAKQSGLIDENQLYMTPDENEYMKNIGNILDICSKDEIKTNKIWTNGKPIYRKVIEISPTTTGSFINASHGISEIEEITSKIGYLSTLGYFYFSDYAEDTTHRVLIVPQTNQISYFIGTGIALNNAKLIVILEYTKTNDVGGDTNVIITTKPDFYSEEERVVGTWTNGKPLYRKVFQQSSTADIDISSLNAENVVIKEAYLEIIDGQNNKYVMTPYYSASNDNFKILLVPVNILRTVTSQTSISKEVIIIEYTKSTDIVDSNLEGEYFLRQFESYSTEEKAIGKWINGKTLYQRTLEFSSPTSSDTQVIVGTISNLDICVEAIGMSLVGSEYLHLPVNTNTHQYYLITGVKTNGGIYCQQKGLPSLKCYLTVKYTKTTD